MDGRLINSITDTKLKLGNVSRTTVYRLIDQGELERVRIGTRAFITQESLEAYVARLTKVAS